MTAQNNPKGFEPVKTLRGDNNFRSHFYHRTSSGAESADQIFPGDPVKIQAGGVPTLVSAGDGVQAMLGVVKAVYDSKKKPRTFSLPDGNAFLSASTEGWLEVYDDPDIIYRIQSDVSVVEADIGANIQVTAGSPTTASNRSGYKAGSITTTSTAPFKIYGLSNFEIDGDPPGSDYGGNNRDLLVVMNNAHFRRVAGI